MMRIAMLCAAAALATAAPGADAGSFAVTPLSAELGKSKSVSFTVNNTGTTPLSFQVAVRRWTQDAKGEEKYEETKDLVIFPAQLEVPGGGKRIVRVGYEGAAPATEGAYRVFIEELPPAANPGQGRKGAVAVVGRFALPVFVKPANAKGALTIDEASAKGGTYMVKVTNGGTSRVRLASLTAGSGADSAAVLANPYVFAGSTREFSGPLGAACKPGTKVTVTATTQAGPKAAKELTLPPDACRG
jgi:fimbrial chaperone protein